MRHREMGYYLMVMASVVIVLAGAKSAAEIIVPFLLSLFIAIILSPSYNFFNKKGLPNALSLTIVITLFIVFIILIAKLIGSSAHEFSSNIEFYQQQLNIYFNKLSSFAVNMGVEIPQNEIADIINTKEIMHFCTNIILSISSMFTNGFVILLTVIFMMLESSYFKNKIEYMTSNKRAKEHIEEIVGRIQEYMVLKSLISLLTAFIVWIALLIIGTDYAFLWAVLAFILNFIPNIGSIIAAIPAVLLTLVQLGMMSAIIVSGVYIAVNVIIGSVVEPRVIGKGLGLSTLVVFLSLIFWGWIFGVVGMLLSIPLTIIAKIVFNANENTRTLAVFLGTGETVERNSK